MTTTRGRITTSVATVAIVVGTFLAAPSQQMATAQAEVFRSPLHLAVSPDGKTVYATDRTGGNVTVLDIAGGGKPIEIKLDGEEHLIMREEDVLGVIDS